MRPRTLQINTIISPQKDIIFFQLCHFGFVLVKCFFHVASLFFILFNFKTQKTHETKTGYTHMGDDKLLSPCVDLRLIIT